MAAPHAASALVKLVRKRESAVASAQAYHAEHSISIDQEPSALPLPCLALAKAPLPPPLLKALRRRFDAPTPIQAITWPLAAAGRDILAIAQTGGGKTLAVLLPALAACHARLRAEERTPSCLVLVPTRELAEQHLREAEAFGGALGLRAAAVYGGVPRQSQEAALRRGADLVVATPGRMLDLLQLHSEAASAAKGMPCKFFARGRCAKGAACRFKHAGPGGEAEPPSAAAAAPATSLARCSVLVLDEADMMLALGFERYVRALAAEMAAPRQTLLCTATWPVEVQRVASELLRPERVRVSVGGGAERLTAAAEVEQRVHVVEPAGKWDALLRVLRAHRPAGEARGGERGGEPRRLLIFANTKAAVRQIGESCAAAGLCADTLSSERSQEERARTLGRFEAGELPLLVATGVASRGLHVEGVDVINYDFPLTLSEYVHRIGRTGRAGARGTAESLFTRDDARHAPPLVEVLQRSSQPVPEELAALAAAAAGSADAEGGAGAGAEAAPPPPSRRSQKRARARAEGTGGRKLPRQHLASESAAGGGGGGGAKGATARGSVAAEPSFKSSKERRAHFKAHRVTLLEPPRSEKRKAADEPAGSQWRVI